MNTTSHWIEMSEAQTRQYIDAESVFTALEAARREAQEVRGSMMWRELHGKTRLIRVSAAGAHTSLGELSDETQQQYDRFTARKTLLEARVATLKQQMEMHERLNRALRLGRVPNIVVATLKALQERDLLEHFTVVGTHALYAYEVACGVRIRSDALATQDVDLLFDTHQRVRFLTRMDRLNSSLLGVLRKVDPTFKIRQDRKETAVNADGFEVDIVRRTKKATDKHPMRMTERPHAGDPDGEDEEFYAVQISSGEQLVYGPKFSQVVVASNGSMARMPTVAPSVFVGVKRAIAQRADRNPLKRNKDVLQADLVAELVEQYLPHLQQQAVPVDRPRETG
jgi:hypothetical protein